MSTNPFLALVPEKKPLLYNASPTDAPIDFAKYKTASVPLAVPAKVTPTGTIASSSDNPFASLIPAKKSLLDTGAPAPSFYETALKLYNQTSLPPNQSTPEGARFVAPPTVSPFEKLIPEAGPQSSANADPTFRIVKTLHDSLTKPVWETLVQPVLRSMAETGKMFLAPSEEEPESPLSKLLYGPGPIKSKTLRAAEEIEAGRNPTLAVGGAVLFGTLDLLPFGGSRAGVTTAMKAARTEEEAIRILARLGLPEDLVKFYAPEVVKVADDTAAKALFGSIERAVKTTKPAQAARTAPIFEGGGAATRQIDDLLPETPRSIYESAPILADESRKYATAEEFVSSMSRVFDETNPFAVDTTKIAPEKQAIVEAFQQYAASPEAKKLYDAGATDAQVLSELFTKVRSLPQTAEEAAARYWDEVIKKQIDEGRGITLGADDLKDYFGADYADIRHKIYSEATYQNLFPRALQATNVEDVVLVGGGPGSGKTEGIVKQLRGAGFDGLIYDSNASSKQGVSDLIDQIRASGKNPIVIGVIPDVGRSAEFALGRSRQVSSDAFATGHTSFPQVMRELLAEGKLPKENVKLVDTRGLNLDQFKKNVALGKYANDPLALLEEARYNHSHVKQLFEERQVRLRQSSPRPGENDGGISTSLRGGGKGGGTDAGGVGRAKIADGVNAPRFAERAKESTQLSQSTRDAIELRAKQTVTNKETVETAKNMVAKSPEAATRFVMTSGEKTAEHTATAIELMRYHDARGDAKAAADIAEHVAEDLVRGGQFIQAARLLERLSPEGVLVSAQRIIKDVNEGLKKIGKDPVEIDEAFIQKLYDLAKKRQDAADPLIKEELGWEIGAMLASLKRVTIGEKVSMFQTLAQLINPKTILVRNPLGNELFYRLERFNKYVATPIDWARSKMTGADRTVTFYNAGVKGAYWKNFLRGTRAGWKGATPGMLPTQLDIGRQVFKSKYNPLHWGEKMLGAALRGFDFAAYSRAKNQTIGEIAYIKAINEGKTGSSAKAAAVRYAKEVDDNILKIADEYGRYITFQDDNMFSKGLSAMKKGLNVGQAFGVGDLTIKYPRTPGALLMRGIEYSPAGFVRSAYLLARPFIKGRRAEDPREIVMAVSRAITGTLGFTGMGYYLADKGVITGKSDKDKDIRALERQTGGGQYRINISALRRLITSGFKDSGGTQRGDWMYSYDWAQPVAISLSIGANINDQIDEGKLEGAGLAAAALASLEGGINTIVEQPLLQGVRRIFGYGDILGGLTQTAAGAASSFVPTLSNQLNQWIDNTRRNAYNPNVLKQGINYAKMKIPGFAQTLDPMVDTFGQTGEVFQGNSNNIFNVFFNPGFTTQYATTPESQLVIDVIEKTGEKGVAPRIAATSVAGRDLTPEEYERFQRTIGAGTLQAFGAFASSEAFMALPDARKATLMEQALTEMGQRAKDELLGTSEAPTITWKDRLFYQEIMYTALTQSEAAAIKKVDALSDDDYERYKSVRTGERQRNTTELRRLLSTNPAAAVIFLKSQLPGEQQRLLGVMTDDEYDIYKSAK